MPPSSDNSATLVRRRVFRASRRRVFRAWVEPEALVSWFRPGGMGVTVHKMDVRTGGSFHFALENGGSIFGTYLLVAPPEKLVFTWSGDAAGGRETIVTLDFLDQGSMTEIVLTHEGLSDPALRTFFDSGWRPLLEALAEALSTDDAPRS